MDFKKFAEEWNADHREPTILGYSISSTQHSIESKLFQHLGDANVLVHFLITELLQIQGDSLAAFASQAAMMHHSKIDEYTEFLCSEDFYLVDCHDADVVRWEACETIANSLSSSIEEFWYAHEEVDINQNSWATQCKQVMQHFGGIPAACAASALGGIALATELIKGRRYQYAWAACSGAQGLAMFAEGQILMAEELRNKSIEHGKQGAQKRHHPMRDLRNWTLAEYGKRSWGSANSAAFELAPLAIEQGRRIGAYISPANAQRTIAEWIRKSV